ncbi:MAG: AEC family transporter [Bauldia sp.]|nr:AEC family transporter [Bauldia sp.]
MDNFVLVGACFLLGMVLRRSGRLPDNAAAAFNGFVVHISLPALTLTYVHGLKLDTSLIMPALSAWVLFGLGAAFFWGAGRLLAFPPATTGGLMLIGGLANTSFIGLPMIQTFYGAEYLGLGILIDQVGSYFVLSTLGIFVASLYSTGQSVDVRAIARKVALFTPFQAFVLALILIPVTYPAWLDGLLRSLGGTLVPIALVSVGYQLHLSAVRGKALPLAVGLVFKLVVGPALILALFAGLLGSEGRLLQITVFEAAMPPMIGASIVAMDHELDPPLVTLMVGIGIPLAFLTLPAWYHLLGGF